MFNFFSKLKNIIDNILFIFLSIIITTILICVSMQIFSRYFFSSPLVFTEELVRFLLIWLGLLGAGYTFGKKGHISLTLLLDKLPNKIQNIMNIIIEVLILIFAIFILLLGGINLILVTKNQVSSVLSIPIWYVYLSAPISGLIIIFYQIYYITLSLLKIKEGR